VVVVLVEGGRGMEYFYSCLELATSWRTCILLIPVPEACSVGRLRLSVPHKTLALTKTQAPCVEYSRP
jgi:hypothetical protein